MHSPRRTPRQGDGHHLGLLAIVVGLLCASPAPLSAQDTWQWSPSQPYHDATVKIWQAGKYTGSGILIGSNESGTLGYVLTAAHTVADDEFAGCEWEDKTKSAGKVILTDKEADLAIMTCDPPDGAQVAQVADELPEKGEPCDHTGWGGDEPIELRTFYGHYMHTESEGSTFTNTSAIKGDSGGGVWHEGELIGIIQGGKYRVSNGQEVNFPARSASLADIQDLCSRLNKIPVEEIAQAARAQMPPNYFEFLGHQVTIEADPEGVTITTDQGVNIIQPPPVEVEAKPEPEPPPAPRAQPAAQPPPAVAQIVSIDTGMISKAVVEYITEQDMIPARKMDEAEIVIRISTRLAADDDFATLVAGKILDEIEVQVLDRIGKILLDAAKKQR